MGEHPILHSPPGCTSSQSVSTSTSVRHTLRGRRYQWEMPLSAVFRADSPLCPLLPQRYVSGKPLTNDDGYVDLREGSTAKGEQDKVLLYKIDANHRIRPNAWHFSFECPPN